MGLSVLEWLKRRFKTIELLPQNFKPKKITLVLNDEYPAFTVMEAERLVRAAAQINRNLKFAAGYVLVPEAVGFINVKSACGVHISHATDYFSRMCIKRHIKNGVIFEGTEGVYIDATVTIGKSARIAAPCRICGKTQIGSGAYVGAYSNIVNAHVCKNATVISSHIIDSEVDEGARVGPWAYLRANAYVGKNCRIGDFVEIKNSHVSKESKIAHLAYVGDAVLGENVNVGCGAVFANYDGKIKRTSLVEDNVFIGCNCNIIAPSHIKRGAYIAAGTTVCGVVEELGLCIGRVRERTVANGAAGRYKNG